MLDINQKQSVQYCIPLWVRDEQIKANIKRVKDRLGPHDLRSDPIAIVGYGPSLNDTWKKVKNFRYIMTCSGAHKFLIEKGVIPTWHVDVDPREHKTHLIGEPHAKVEYLMASCIHPKMIDLLEGYKLKLWHVFAQDNESDVVIPRGEWAVTGGCDAGMRCMTIARFLGFKDFHIFGIDGSEGATGKHAAQHPNQPKESQSVEYSGRTFQSTPALVECARQVFHELDQLRDVKFRFYGDALIQRMAKDYKRKDVTEGDVGAIAFSKPELISPEMRDLNARLHQDNAFYGVGGGKYADVVLKLSEQLKTQSVLDYGCGKGYLGKALPFPIWEYDPAIPEKSQSPRPAALVVCTDVLEHVEPDKLKFVLDDLKRVTQQVGYFVIHIGAAKKTYADGRNTHLIQKDIQWWAKQLSKFFAVGKIVDHGHEIHVVVGPKITAPPPPTIEVEHNGAKAKFHIPNNVTKWRAETLFKKEPITIEWIEGMERGDVFYDVGANVGGYSVWAGIKGLRVYSFEPQADNYSMLVQNMLLNQLEPEAYCIALSDFSKLSKLYLSGNEVGGSCHSFEESVSPDLQPRKKGFFHGAVGMSLDELVERGLPKPNHIKIDVDGFEFRVIKGAEKTLSNCSVKSLLVEVNDSIPEHREMLRYLSELGYEFNAEQVEKAKRKDGPFKGVAEYVFRKGNNVGIQVGEIEAKLIEVLSTAVVVKEPFPHIYVENFLFETLYSYIIEQLPKRYQPINKVRSVNGYPQRFVSKGTSLAWQILDEALKSGPFKRALCDKFGVSSEDLTDETLLIRDKPGYAIGPHTDHPDKVISALFYLKGKEGTSLYTAREEGFTCEGGPHYSLNKFKRVKTVPFKPNSLFAFLKTNRSFHGVEKTKHQRDVLLYDVRRI